MTTSFPFADFSNVSTSIEKLVALNTSKFEAAVEAQTAATKELVELTQTRIKALTEVKDFDGLNSFCKEQNELAQKAITKAIEDSKVAVDDAVAYGEEVKNITTAGFEAATTEVKKAGKKAA